MRKVLLAVCAVAALGFGVIPAVSASEFDGEKVILEHGHGGGGWGHRGGGRGGRGWGGGRGGYYGGGCGGW